MTPITDTKPEPIAAKPNWHYDSYFIAQLKRLNLLRPDSALKKPRKIIVKTDDRTEELESETNSNKDL
jgi:hypothetical protein